MTNLKNIMPVIRKVAFMMIAGMLINGAVWASKDENKPASEPAKKGSVVTGVASWYGKQFHGQKTANGEIYNKHRFTCASNKYPLGTWLKVTNLKNGRSVILKVNDRMHPRMTRIVDISRGAAEELKMVSAGIAKVSVENLGKTLPAKLK